MIELKQTREMNTWFLYAQETHYVKTFLMCAFVFVCTEILTCTERHGRKEVLNVALHLRKV